MIYDTFPFFNELDLLEIRLNILDPVVDRFVLVEATRTFTGKPKPLYYENNKLRFAAFADKIIHVVVDDYPPFESPWTNENHQRNCILRGLTDAKPGDRILLNDLDEIPRPELVREYAAKPGSFQFDLDYYAYYLNCRNVTDPHWKAAKLVSFEVLQHGLDGRKIRYNSFLLPAMNHGTTPTAIRRSWLLEAKTIPHGGWHFSSLGGGKAVIEKMSSFAHSEFDSPQKHDAGQIEHEIQNGKSPLYRIRHFAVPLDDRFPDYLVRNQTKYGHLLFPVDDNYLKKTRWPRRWHSLTGRVNAGLRFLIPAGILDYLHDIRVGLRHQRSTNTRHETSSHDASTLRKKTGRPDVSICLLTWNRSRFLDICLSELFKSITPAEQGGLSREILIMDNASTDDTPKVLAKYAEHPDVTIIRNKKNLRFSAYKWLFLKARGRIIIDLDDDVLQFPKDFDRTLVEYLEVFKDYGFLACNVVQNDKTNGARPRNAVYAEDVRGDKIVEEGPTGGWCSAFWRSDWFWIKYLIFLFRIDAKTPEDAYIASLCWRLHKRIGIIREAVVLHANGPVYSKEFNYLERDIEKYVTQNNPEGAQAYERALHGNGILNS